MKTDFKIGTHLFHKEPNMNYQFNRIYAISGGDIREIRSVAAKVQTIEDWIEEFLNLARKALAENRLEQAAGYFRAANFYLSCKDPRKRETYEKYVAMVRDIHKEKFQNGTIKEFKVPFQDGFLPVWHIDPQDLAAERNIVVMHLGYDSFKEELIPIIDYFRRANMELYLFEGPGQGEALHRYNLHMMHEWEKPVAAILDYFNLNNVTLIGLSLGGYLAPRAAAFEQRVCRVIAWGVMYDFFDTVLSRRGKFFEVFLKTMLALHASGIINAAARLKMKRDTYARWGIEHGLYVYGVKTPYEYFNKLKMYSTKNISQLVKQDFLLLGSTHDHFIPKEHFYRQAEKLVKVRSFTGRIFTKYENAENHVSFGNMPLVLDCIIGWIREHTGQRNA